MLTTTWPGDTVLQGRQQVINRRGTVNAIVRPAEEGGFWAEVLELPGCVSQGETEDELFHNIVEAIEACMEAGSEPMLDEDSPHPDVWRVPVPV